MSTTPKASRSPPTVSARPWLTGDFVLGADGLRRRRMEEGHRPSDERIRERCRPPRASRPMVMAASPMLNGTCRLSRQPVRTYVVVMQAKSRWSVVVRLAPSTFRKREMTVSSSHPHRRDLPARRPRRHHPRIRPGCLKSAPQARAARSTRSPSATIHSLDDTPSASITSYSK